MEKENTDGLTEGFTRESTRTISNTAGVFIPGWMESDMRGSGKTESKMEKESCSSLTGELLRQYGREESELKTVGRMK